VITSVSWLAIPNRCYLSASLWEVSVKRDAQKGASEAKSKGEEVSLKDIKIRLDVLIRLYIESLKMVEDPNKRMNEGVAARVLSSAGMTPTEIALVLGKSSRTSVAGYLYGKKKTKRSRRKS